MSDNELEKKLERIRKRQEVNKKWIELSKSNRSSVKDENPNESKPEEPVAKSTLIDKIHDIDIELKAPKVHFPTLNLMEFLSKTFLGFYESIILGRQKRQDRKLFAITPQFLRAYKVAVFVDAKKHRLRH